LSHHLTTLTTIHIQNMMNTSPPPPWLNIARNSCLRVPPLWPLHSFVAVNPFVGLVGKPFAEVCDLMARVTHDSMLMSCDYFWQHYDNQRISLADLSTAVARAKSAHTPAELIDWVQSSPLEVPVAIQSVADLATDAAPGHWLTLITEEISKWCAAYFDEGQSAWRMPWKKLPLYAAWRQAASIDATPELLGLTGFRARVAALPDTAAAAIPALLEKLQLSEQGAEDYLHRLLMTLPGWSSYVQYRVRDKAMHGQQDEALLDLLAVRLVCEVALLEKIAPSDLHRLWAANASAADATTSAATAKLLLWHSALEIGFQRDLCNRLLAAAATSAAPPQSRPTLQAIFCIDVRSEVMRRALEATSPEIETLGFAGFFGMFIEHVPFDQRHGSPQVPVLFSPKYRIREHLPHATPAQEKTVLRQLQLGRRLNHSWNAFKTSAVSCFSFVETAGVGFAWKLVKDSFQLDTKSHSHSCSTCAVPNLQHHPHAAQDAHDEARIESGIPAADQVQIVMAALKNMGLTSNFARLVMVCGHGSNTTNNPYAAGLDCGACGGHAGDSNARVAAAILNQPTVRAGLAAQGIHIPGDTHFLAALHDTTTDRITLFDLPQVPATHQADLQQIQAWLHAATHSTRCLRSPTLGLGGVTGEQLDASIIQRSLDWAQVRPEWGLAGNAAFIAAPRERTRSLNLQGRVFLHNYNHAADPQKSTLELIMIAPMVVANWINLQYYASTVNNRLWGSGNKVTHNVVGTFGIQQGNGGDMQAGLPLQSLHDGEKWVHEPLRLSVFIEAPCADIDAVISKHASVLQLVDNGWLHLHAIEDSGRSIKHYIAGGGWVTHGEQEA
jgi:uncharacterized protein YbcC (UPF0753/DUF2309 family)